MDSDIAVKLLQIVVMPMLFGLFSVLMAMLNGRLNRNEAETQKMRDSFSHMIEDLGDRMLEKNEKQDDKYDILRKDLSIIQINLEKIGNLIDLTLGKFKINN